MGHKPIGPRPVQSGRRIQRRPNHVDCVQSNARFALKGVGTESTRTGVRPCPVETPTHRGHRSRVGADAASTPPSYFIPSPLLHLRASERNRTELGEPGPPGRGHRPALFAFIRMHGTTLSPSNHWRSVMRFHARGGRQRDTRKRTATPLGSWCRAAGDHGGHSAQSARGHAG